MKACLYPLCPAFAVEGLEFCPVHKRHEQTPAAAPDCDCEATCDRCVAATFEAAEVSPEETAAAIATRMRIARLYRHGLFA